MKMSKKELLQFLNKLRGIINVVAVRAQVWRTT
jgi:hypothetical protein